jgi:uncharacterized secreted protein with C-terminal beta-propeller domain
MSGKLKYICILLVVSILFGILSVGCSADVSSLHILTDKIGTPGSESAETTNEQTGKQNTDDKADSGKKTDSDGAEDKAEEQAHTVVAVERNLDTFESESELLDYINEHFSNDMIICYDDYAMETETADIMPEAEMPAATNSGGADVKAESGRDVSSTNLVDENVDEGDCLKTDGDYIYIIRDNELITVSAKGKETDVLSYYKLFAAGEGNVSEMYIKGDKAIVIANVTFYDTPEFVPDTSFGKPVEDSEDIYAPEEYYYYDYYGYNNAKTYSALYVIDISDREKPKEESHFFVEGYLVASRETNGRVYLVANKNINYYWGGPVTAASVLPGIYDTKSGYRTVVVTNVARPAFETVYPNMMTVASIDFRNIENSDTVTVLGSGTDIYMTAESLYLFCNTGSDTCVAKYSVGDTLSYVASVKVPGYTATDYSYNEYNGKFRIATTVYGKDGTENNVYVYNEKLEKTGELTGLALKEKIYSVRFTGDVAYLVTFRQVDPLFVIDMSGDDPKVMGELKVPGFSTYLHPVGDGLLLGIGKETKDNEWTDYYGNKYTSTYTDGIKISLFDVSDPFNPTEKDVENYIGGEYASTEAWSNHRAFVYSAAKNTGYFDINANDGNGFVCVSIENGKLICRTVYPSAHYSYYSGNSRVCYVDDVIYFYQYNRISVFDRNTLEEIATVTVK